MNLRGRFGVIAGAVLLSGILFAGAALASGWSGGPAGELTQGQKDTLKQLMELRKSHMEKMKAEATALIDQAVKDGKITQEQGDKMLRFPAKPGMRRGPWGHEKKGHFEPGVRGASDVLR